MIRSVRILVLFCLASPLFAQQVNTTSFVPTANYGSDSINLQTIVPIISLPVRSKPGPLPLSAGISGASQCVTQATPLTWDCSGLASSTPLRYNGFALNVGGLNLQLQPTVVNTTTCPSSNGHQVKEYENWYVTDATGHGWHPLATTLILFDTYCAGSITGTTLDGSGLTVTITTTWNSVSQTMSATASIVDKFGNTSAFPSQGFGGTGVIVSSNSLTDPFSNAITFSSSSNEYIDPLAPSSYALKVPTTAGNAWQYLDATSTSQSITPTMTSETLKTSFSCGTITEASGSRSFPTKVSFPDSTSESIAYESIQANTITGRISSITLRTGGQVQYTYGSMDCTQFRPLSLTRIGADGTTTFTVSVSGSNNGSTTTVRDPGKNKTVYTFTGYYASNVAPSLSNTFVPALTEVQIYQNTGTIASPIDTLLTTDVYCYNGNTTSCSSAAVTYPVTEIQDTHTINGMSNSSKTVTFIDGGPTGGCAGGTANCYGNVTEVDAYDFGGSTPTQKNFIAYGSWTSGNSCSSIGSSIFGKPCYVQTDLGGNNVQRSEFQYNSNGALTKSLDLTTGSTYLSTTYSPNSNGTLGSVTPPGGATVSFSYSTSTGCPTSGTGLLPTGTSVTVVTGDTLTTATSYECNGGTVTGTTDPNSNSSTIAFNDSLFRLSSAADPYSFTYTPCYGTLSGATCTASATSVSGSSTKFNSNNSQIISNNVVDTFGRPITSQVGQGPSSSNFDTVSTSYGWGGTNSTNRMVSTSAPCTATSGSNCSSYPHSTQFDPLGRPINSSTTSFETVTTTYTQNDVLADLSPHPTGENDKQNQSEYDGLGRLKSTCDISSTVTGNALCNQNTNTTAKGILTTVSYSSGAASQTITATRSSESRTATSDALGRITSENYPETAGTNFTYTYDATATATCSWLTTPNLSGHLALMKDPVGNNLCYSYDAIGRLAQVNANGTSCRHYYYDNSTGYSGTIPTGVTVANNLGQMVEAATDTCASNTLVTDEWFSYDKNGRMTDLWESTPHSSGYFHTTVSYWPNGALETLSGIPSFHAINYGVDGEGRESSAIMQSSPTETLVSSTTYDNADNPLVITLGTGDSDTYTYDTNENMKSYSYAVGTATDAATLTWNANNTLGSAAITDGFNSGGTQTCTFGYDDLARVSSDNCGMTLGSQSYGYDQYDNLTTTANGLGVTWNPSYNTNNQYSGISATYDADGHLTYDTFYYYYWNEFGQMAKMNSVSTVTCGTSGVCLTYDAFGQVVEKTYLTSYYEFIFSPVGRVGLNSNYVTVPLPGGSKTISNAFGSVNNYQHLDWQSSARAESSLENSSVFYDRAFTPYGYEYDNFGSTTYQHFGGMDQFDLNLQNIFDTPNRMIMGEQGRFLSPDPAHSGWNQYAYTTNPNSFTDPSGLCDQQGSREDCPDPEVTTWQHGPLGGICVGGDCTVVIDLGAFGGRPAMIDLVGGAPTTTSNIELVTPSASIPWGPPDMMGSEINSMLNAIGASLNALANGVLGNPVPIRRTNWQQGGNQTTGYGYIRPGQLFLDVALVGAFDLQGIISRIMDWEGEVYTRPSTLPGYGMVSDLNGELYGNHFLHGGVGASNSTYSLTSLAAKDGPLGAAARRTLDNFVGSSGKPLQVFIQDEPRLVKFYQSVAEATGNRKWEILTGPEARAQYMKNGLYWKRP